VIKILQGSVVTQTMLGGLTIHPPVANFLQCMRAKNYENWLRVDKVIAMKAVCSFFGPPCRLLSKIPPHYYFWCTVYSSPREARRAILGQMQG